MPPTLRLPPFQVFAVDHDVVQCTWRHGVGGRPGPTAITIPHHGGDQLRVEVGDATIEVAVGDRWFGGSDLGQPLARIATVNDCHLGLDSFGLLDRLEEPGISAAALRAAFAEAAAWGAELIVVKGDVTHHSTPDEWAEFAECCAGAEVPIVATRGNHDAKSAADAAADPSAAGDVAVAWGDHVGVVDLAGVRALVCDTAITDRAPGRLAHVRDRLVGHAAEAAAEDRSILVLQHHWLQRWRLPHAYPPGIGGPEASGVLAAVRRANRRVFVSAGHSHRHRALRRAGVRVTEVGSVRDHPGTWAGYTIYEGGVRQAVFRVEHPAVLAWTERCRRVLGGWWGRWAAGTRPDRCVIERW